MKRAKFFVSIATIATLLIGSAVSTFAADEVKPVAATEVKAEAKTYADLSFKEKGYYETTYYLGTYPVIDGMDELNAKIYDFIWKKYRDLPNNSVNFISTQQSVSYEVENFNQYACVAINIDMKNATDINIVKDYTSVYYINKDGMVEMTQDEFEAATAKIEEEEAVAEAAAEAEAEANEDIVLVGLRKAIDGSGYELKWDDETQSVTITKGDFKTTITVDVNEFTVDGEKVELDSAPVKQDGSVYVSVKFLEKVLGATTKVFEDGTVEVSFK